MKGSLNFHEKYGIALAHFDAAGKEKTAWVCACAECEKLREWQKQRQIRQNRKREHVHLLIQIMVAREQNRASDLAKYQFDFERIMVRKLGLDYLDTAEIYGVRRKSKKLLAGRGPVEAPESRHREASDSAAGFSSPIAEAA
ncbi:MAG TPA: hypothetical protein VNT99_08395 [Methylomirabilota bacterium]|nr:hypothetical protein [Methylomirabilota bacterium]